MSVYLVYAKYFLKFLKHFYFVVNYLRFQEQLEIYHYYTLQ